MTEKRIKAGIALTPRHLKLCDDNLRRAGVRSRNDFVERAIVCYADQLLRQELPELPGGGFDGSRFETLCKSLGTGQYKMAVELAMEQELSLIQEDSAQEVKKLGSVPTFQKCWQRQTQGRPLTE